MTSDHAIAFLVSQGIPRSNIMLLGDEFACLTPAAITSNLSASLAELLSSLKIPPNTTTVNPLISDNPVCIDYAALAHAVCHMQTVRDGGPRKAFGQFGYTPDANKVPAALKGFLHAVNWAIHTTPEGVLSLAFYEPQLGLQPGSGAGGELRPLTSTEIASCTNCIGY